jgi:hypothetical protein
LSATSKWSTHSWATDERIEKAMSAARTQTEITAHVRGLLGSELWDRYILLSFAEMAEQPELAPWRDQLLQAEEEWWRQE